MNKNTYSNIRVIIWSFNMSQYLCYACSPYGTQQTTDLAVLYFAHNITTVRIIFFLLRPTLSLSGSLFLLLLLLRRPHFFGENSFEANRKWRVKEEKRKCDAAASQRANVHFPIRRSALYTRSGYCSFTVASFVSNSIPLIFSLKFQVRQSHKWSVRERIVRLCSVTIFFWASQKRLDALGFSTWIQCLPESYSLSMCAGSFFFSATVRYIYIQFFIRSIQLCGTSFSGCGHCALLGNNIFCSCCSARYIVASLSTVNRPSAHFYE